MGKDTDSSNFYGIGAVARLTGITTHTLRMWEHRYQAVVAQRKANGRRIYTAADVEKLSMLKALTDRGTAISSIAGLSRSGLRKRLEQDQALEAPVKGDIAVAVMGATLPTVLRRAAEQEHRIGLVAGGTEPGELHTEIAGRRVDCLVMEFPVLDSHALQLSRELQKQYQPASTVLVFRFGRSTDLSSLSAKGVLPLRSPVTGPELVAAVVSASASRQNTKARPQAASDPGASKRRAVLAPAPQRRYSGEQLSRLADISTSVDCECPRHLAEILSALAAFEVYSRNCEQADPDQAALHAYLHNATGHARGIMEEALSHLVEIENITI